MPVLDLRDPQDGRRLGPFAPFKVLAVMCHPADRKARQSMLAPLIAEIEGAPSPPGYDEEFLRQVRFHADYGANTAGLVLMTAVQLQHAGRRPSLNNVIKILQPSGLGVTSSQMPEGPDWREWISGPKIRTHRATVFRAFEEYRLVSHFWAALALEITEGREAEPVLIGSNDTLPVFLGVADAVMVLAKRVAFEGRTRRQRLLEPNKVWRFTIPPLIDPLGLSVPPLAPAALQALDQEKST